MRRRDFIVTPTAGIIVVVIAALSAVVGIVVNFVSSQQSDVPAQTAQRVEDLRQAAPSAANDAGAVDIPAFALATVTGEPDALIWWDAPAKSTPTAQPTATPLPAPTVVYIVVTPTPAAVAAVAAQQVVYLIATPTPVVFAEASVMTPLGQMPCSEIYLEWGGTDARAQQRDWLPWASWFESISRQERLRYWSMCGGGQHG